MNSGNLAQELARGVGGGMVRMENDVGDVANTEFDAVVALQILALNPLAVDERSMFTALVNDEEFSVFGCDQGVIAGDTRVGDDQVLVDFPSYGEGSVVEIEGALLVALNEDECREDPRSWGRG